MDKKNKIKLVVAIVAFLAAGVLITWQFMPAKPPPGSGTTATVEDIVSTKGKDGSIITKQGGRIQREVPTGK